MKNWGSPDFSFFFISLKLCRFMGIFFGFFLMISCGCFFWTDWYNLIFAYNPDASHSSMLFWSLFWCVFCLSFPFPSCWFTYWIGWYSCTVIDRDPGCGCYFQFYCNEGLGVYLVIYLILSSSYYPTGTLMPSSSRL